jgi:phage terminase large subunit-like protein
VPNASSWPPRWLTDPGASGARAGDWLEFIEEYCRITKDSFAGGAGEKIRLRQWQRDLIGTLLAERPDGRLRHRQALIGMPRKNGKSALGSSLALAALVLGPNGGEVYSCAGDRDQARIVFGMARRMVELDPELSGVLKTYRDAIEDPTTGSVYRVLSSEAFTKEGLSPTFVIFDEVHVQPNDELWNVMALAAGARVEPLMIGITTAGVRTDTLGNDTLCYRLYQHGQKVASGELVDPSFFFAWWEPAGGTTVDHHDPDVWEEANPGFDDLVSAEDFASTVLRTPEAEFRTKRTNVWVTSTETALPHGAWDRCEDPDRDTTDAEWVVFVDGSWSGDCTAIVGATCGDRPHVVELGLWELPIDDPHWRVPILEVKAAIERLCRTMQVRHVAFDPYRWQHTMAELEADGLPVEEFATGSVPRMVPAWKKFYDAVLDQELTHDGSAALARHISNMQLKYDQSGARPVKEHRHSQRHIDLGICAVGAVDLALQLEEPVPEPAVFFV